MPKFSAPLGTWEEGAVSMVVSKSEEHLSPAYPAGSPVLPNTRPTRGVGSAPGALLWRGVLGNMPAVSALR